MIGALVALVMLIALMVIVASVVRMPKLPPPLVLPTGETVILRGVTYGTNHPAPDVPRWFRLLPTRARNWLAPHVLKNPRLFQDRTSAEPKLLLWIEVQNPHPALPPAANRQVWFALADENGQRCCGYTSVDLAVGTNFGTVVESVAFPRRAKQFQGTMGPSSALREYKRGGAMGGPKPSADFDPSLAGGGAAGNPARR